MTTLVCDKHGEWYTVYLDEILKLNDRSWTYVQERIAKYESEYNVECKYVGFGAGWNPTKKKDTHRIAYAKVRFTRKRIDSPTYNLIDVSLSDRLFLGNVLWVVSEFLDDGQVLIKMEATDEYCRLPEALVAEGIGDYHTFMYHYMR